MAVVTGPLPWRVLRDRPAAGVRGVLPAAAGGDARVQHQGARHRRAHRRGVAQPRRRPDHERGDRRPRCCSRCSPSSVMLVLLVPTMIWVRLRVPRRPRLVEFLCLLPLTIPALVLVVGLRRLRLGQLPRRRLGAHAHLRVHRPGAAVRLPRDRRRPVVDRRADPGRGRPLARRGLVHRDRPGGLPNIRTASSARRSSRWRWCSASSPSPRCCTTTRCRWSSSCSARATPRCRWRPRSPRSARLRPAVLLSFLDRRRRPSEGK